MINHFTDYITGLKEQSLKQPYCKYSFFHHGQLSKFREKSRHNSTSSLFAAFPESQDVPGQVEYPDDFEEAEAGEEYEADATLAAPHDDALEEEFQLCDAGGLTIILKALKENG